MAIPMSSILDDLKLSFLNAKRDREDDEYDEDNNNNNNEKKIHVSNIHSGGRIITIAARRLMFTGDDSFRFHMIDLDDFSSIQVPLFCCCVASIGESLAIVLLVHPIQVHRLFSHRKQR
mmetsp:Transcript_60463/g.68533  ORF Transcript_60463/g.68533 Transcript_60463/m.68533 type:complete len:119 (+) Transcript_60463:360-716(+)